jgi:putative membrane protein
MALVLAQMMDRDDVGRGGHWWGWLIGLAVLAVIVGLVVWAVRRTTSHTQSGGPASPPTRRSAEEVLTDRLARGEIEIEEYRQRLSALRDG